MLIEKLWKTIRRFIPVELYPLLAPIYRWRRREQLKRFQEEDSQYLAKHSDLKMPPAELRYNVVGPLTVSQFLSSGELIVNDIKNALRTINSSLDQFRHLLDFGCGCGRLVLALENQELDLEITGCDVDSRAIDWCRQNLGPAKFFVGRALPPSPFDDETFDLIWAGSVFTHLNEQHQDRWLDEMHRIIKPRGVLLASIHGPHCWETRLPPWSVAKLKRQGMMFVRIDAEIGIHPDWYQVAWHTENYIKEHWGSVFEICRYIQRGLTDYQDIIVARKRG